MNIFRQNNDLDPTWNTHEVRYDKREDRIVVETMIIREQITGVCLLHPTLRDLSVVMDLSQVVHPTLFRVVNVSLVTISFFRQDCETWDMNKILWDYKGI